MTLTEALQQRIPRVRLPQWGNPEAYLRLPLLKDGHGPWAELYEERSQQAMDMRPGSQRICVLLPDTEDRWEPYTGPVSAFERHAENLAHLYVEA